MRIYHAHSWLPEVVMGVYSEGEGQSSGNCKSAVTAMAEYLLGAGY